MSIPARGKVCFSLKLFILCCFCFSNWKYIQMNFSHLRSNKWRHFLRDVSSFNNAKLLRWRKKTIWIPGLHRKTLTKKEHCLSPQVENTINNSYFGDQHTLFLFCVRFLCDEKKKHFQNFSTLSNCAYPTTITLISLAHMNMKSQVTTHIEPLIYSILIIIACSSFPFRLFLLRDTKVIR